MDIRKKIKEEMKRQRINGVELSAKSGINYNTLMGFLRGSSSSLSTHKLEKILEVLDLNIIKIL